MNRFVRHVVIPNMVIKIQINLYPCFETYHMAVGVGRQQFLKMSQKMENKNQKFNLEKF